MDDPRFKHIAWDPRFKGIPKRSRKVVVDSRFKSMFTDPQFKVEYKFDKRGRKVNQSSGADLRKFYEIAGDEEEEKKKTRGVDAYSARKGKEELDAAVDSAESVINGGSEIDDTDSAESAIDDGTDSAESAIDDAESAIDDEDGEDLFFARSSGAAGGTKGAEEGGGADDETWGVEEASKVLVSEVSSPRLAVCNMDWDNVGAKDIFVLLSSFKPAGSCIAGVTVYPSDFGLERLAKEDTTGPVGVVGVASDEEDPSCEGAGYSKEKLRRYQINRFKYYYAVVECDGKETAEHIYTRCNGLEYEHSGGQLDLRFIPDGMGFEEREAHSMATEDSIPVDFTPADFVSLALQQSKVKLSWDETDTHRVHVTQKKFTKDDLQSMNFSAYLASASESGDSEEEEEGEGHEDGGRTDKKLRYKELLERDESDSANEEMEITWEPGLKESVQRMVRKRNKDGLTPWEQYLQEKKERRKKKKAGEKAVEKGGAGAKSVETSFDDPFFQHSVTMATAASTKKTKKGKRKVESEQKDKDELALLMMSDEEETGGRSHFSFPAIVRSEKEAKKKKKTKRRETEESQITDDFKVDVSDPRFKAIFESHLYAPDPSHPHYKASKGMGEIMEEGRRRRKESKEQDPATGQPLPDARSLHALVKSVKSKAKLFKAKKRKLKLTQPEK